MNLFVHIEQLKEAYLIGNCDIHPGIHYCKASNGWHFDLSDSYRIKVFANVIVSKWLLVALRILLINH